MLVRLLRPHPGLVARFTIGSLGRAAMTALSILLIREFLAGVLGHGRAFGFTIGAESALWVTVALLLLVSLAAAVFNYDSQVTQQKIVKAIELGTMERMIRHLLGLSVGFLDRRTHGELLESIRQDVIQMRMVVLSTARIVLEVLQTIGLVAAAVSFSVTLSVWAFILVPVGALPIYILARRTLARSFGVREKGVALFDALLQLLHGIRVIKIYQGERAEGERTVDRARVYFDELIEMERVQAFARSVLESLAALNVVVVIIVGGLSVMSGRLGWPELLAFLLAMRAAQGPLNNLNSAYLDVQRYAASVYHIEQLLAEKPEIQDRKDARAFSGSPMSITADHVDFGFNQKPVLQNVSFTVRAGETLGIVGPSGAGKSTLLSLVARFYDPTQGRVLVDGEDLRDLRLRDIYAKLAIVTQDPFLFSTSIRENILCGRPDATQEEVEEAARAAEIHNEIMAMPDGYETVVGQGGRLLSRGEAQRVNVARAILKNAPILLLDEATSSLDSYSEARVQRAVDQLAVGRLAVSVAHRLSTLRNATRILVLEQGQAVGLGTHQELLADCPTYRRLWEAQGGYVSSIQEDNLELQRRGGHGGPPLQL
ncbi:MAG TPA: ABC transporter ATP-binding protein [Pyrinomonadaceae bacterium]|nr:ABC transporter ATP-binding protein [Pyrinomonadaceae bacterium]